MAKAYSLDLRERVLAAAAEGMLLAEAAARFGVSVPSIVRWRALEREGRGVGPKPFGGGRRSARIEAAREAILALLRENPDLSTEALRAALAERDLVFGYGSLYRFRQRYRALPGTAPVEEPLEAARETVFALLRGNPGLSIRALLAALAERGHVLGYGALYGFLTRHGFKGKQAGRGRDRADESETAAPRAVADDLRERVLAAVEAGRLFRVNPATIARWRRQPRQPGGGDDRPKRIFGAGPRGGPGRPSGLNRNGPPGPALLRAPPCRSGPSPPLARERCSTETDSRPRCPGNWRSTETDSRRRRTHVAGLLPGAPFIQPLLPQRSAASAGQGGTSFIRFVSADSSGPGPYKVFVPSCQYFREKVTYVPTSGPGGALRRPPAPLRLTASLSGIREDGAFRCA